MFQKGCNKKKIQHQVIAPKIHTRSLLSEDLKFVARAEDNIKRAVKHYSYMNILTRKWCFTAMSITQHAHASSAAHNMTNGQPQ